MSSSFPGKIKDIVWIYKFKNRNYKITRKYISIKFLFPSKMITIQAVQTPRSQLNRFNKTTFRVFPGAPLLENIFVYKAEKN